MSIAPLNIAFNYCTYYSLGLEVIGVTMSIIYYYYLFDKILHNFEMHLINGCCI